MLYQSNSFDSVPKINELSGRYVYFIVSTVHSSQDMKANQVFVSRWMDQMGMYTKGMLDICNKKVIHPFVVIWVIYTQGIHLLLLFVSFHGDSGVSNVIFLRFLLCDQKQLGNEGCISVYNWTIVYHEGKLGQELKQRL